MDNNKDSKVVIHDIFDRIYKRIITLSSSTVVRFINGIFDTNYPIDSKLTYNITENVNDNLKKTIADTIVTINNSESYHIEAQMYKDDNSIMLRMFDYGYNYSKHHVEEVINDYGIRSGIKLTFPKQVVLYLDSSINIPDEYSITLILNQNHEYTYTIPTIKFQSEPLQDIINKNMVILLPFKLLKLRSQMKFAYEEYISSQDKKSADEKLRQVTSELSDILRCDIIATIESSYKNGEITRKDMDVLLGLTKRLLDYLYSRYKDVEEVEDMFHDESLDLEIDKLYDSIEEKEVVIAKITEDNKKKDEEIQRLKRELELVKKSI